MTIQQTLSMFTEKAIAVCEANKDFRRWDKVVLEWDVEYCGYDRGENNEEEGHVDFHVIVRIVEAMVDVRVRNKHRKVEKPGYKLAVTQNMASDGMPWENYVAHDECFPIEPFAEKYKYKRKIPCYRKYIRGEEKMDEWKTIDPGVWKPANEGDQIIGVLVNKEPKDETSGISARYYIETDRGMFFVWGSTVLDDRMQYVKVNQKIRITYEGKTKNKRGQDVNLFRVDVSGNGANEDNERCSDGNVNTEAPLFLEKAERIVK